MKTFEEEAAQQWDRRNESLRDRENNIWREKEAQQWEEEEEERAKSRVLLKWIAKWVVYKIMDSLLWALFFRSIIMGLWIHYYGLHFWEVLLWAFNT